MFVKLVGRDTGITKWVSHKVCGVFNSSLPKRKKLILLINSPRTENNKFSLEISKSPSLPILSNFYTVTAR